MRFRRGINLGSFNDLVEIRGVSLCHSITLLFCTGKSLSEALIFASTNPQYDDRLFIELQVQCMKIPSSEHGENMLCTEIVLNA